MNVTVVCIEVDMERVCIFSMYCSCISTCLEVIKSCFSYQADKNCNCLTPFCMRAWGKYCAMCNKRTGHFRGIKIVCEHRQHNAQMEKKQRQWFTSYLQV